MKPTDLIVLLPCHSLEDFPTYHTGDDAEGLLAAWSALWHPSLLTAALKTPTWRRADDPPTPQPGMLLVVPTVVRHELPPDYAERAEAAGAVLIEGLHRRADIVARALAVLSANEPDDAGPAQMDVAEPAGALVADFLAVGLAYLLTELLTRRMRYMSNLNQTEFNDAMLAAATAAASGDEAHARDRLRRACEVLYEARAHFYPVDTYLVDLTLVAATTTGPSFRRELASELPTNVMVTGEVIEQMSRHEPDSLDALRARLAENTATLVGGEYREAELPLLPLETILAEFEKGRQAYRVQLDVTPEVFGRRRAGLDPVLPQILRGLGYKGALHFTLDEGRFPQADRSKALWEGTSATAIDAVGRPPLDAGQASSMLSLVEKLGESMDYDFVSMISFAHWPSMAGEFYEDLRRVSRYAPVLGRFVTLDEFFTSTDSAGAFSKFSADQYRAPYLRQAVKAGIADPLSSHVRRRRIEHTHYAAETCQAWASLLAGRSTENSEASESALIPLDVADAERARGQAQQTLARQLCLPSQRPEGGLLLVNPHSFARREILDVSSLTPPPDVGSTVMAADAHSGTPQAIVEVPPLGFAWVGRGVASSKAGRPPKSIARDNVLVNELCEVTIHPETGGVRGIRDLHARGNRLSQQLAMRLRSAVPMPVGLGRDPDEDAIYSQMVADSIEITANTSVVGEITSRGRLLDHEGRELASFIQRTRLAAARAWLEIDLELALREEPFGDPWERYYACRFAWAEELSEIRRSVHGAAVVTELKRLEAPDFIEVIGTKSRTAILCGGLAHHQRVGPRMLDTLLVVPGENERRFRMAIALEHPQPWQAAAEFVSGPMLVNGHFQPPAQAQAGWLFHIDAKSVQTTRWSPLAEDGAVVGFRVRLLELAGRGLRVTLRTFRDVASARRLTLAGDGAEELSANGNRIEFELGGHEWVELEARWSD